MDEYEVESRVEAYMSYRVSIKWCYHASQTIDGDRKQK